MESYEWASLSIAAMIKKIWIGIVMGRVIPDDPW